LPSEGLSSKTCFVIKNPSVYNPLGRAISYGSYFYNPNTWFSGILLFLFLMTTAFLGYVLPFGQMSFWGATVITNLLSPFPSLIEWHFLIQILSPFFYPNFPIFIRTILLSSKSLHFIPVHSPIKIWSFPSFGELIVILFVKQSLTNSCSVLPRIGFKLNDNKLPVY